MSQCKLNRRRCSIKRDDPGFDMRCGACAVYVNGERMERCHTVDFQHRIAYCYEVDDQDQLVHSGAPDYEINTVERQGVITVECDYP